MLLGEKQISRKLEQQGRRAMELRSLAGGGEANSWRPIYRRWKAVERGALVAGRRASRRPLMAPGVVERRRERRGGSGTTGRVGQGRSEHLGRVERVGA